MSDKPMEIDDLLIENMRAAKKAVMKAFDTKSINELRGWEKLLSSMRGLPDSVMETIGVRIVQRSFKVYGFDCTNPGDRERMLAFQDIVALALQDAMTLIMRNMERSQNAANAIRAGKGSLLV